MNKIFLVITFLSLFSFFTFSLFRDVVSANTEATVDATVETELVSVSVDVTSINYGLIRYGLDKDDSTLITAKNEGNMVEDLTVKGSDATNVADATKKWALIDSSTQKTVDTFKHRYYPNGIGNPSYLTKDYTPVGNLKLSVSPNETATLHLSLETPPSSSATGTYKTSVYIMATKH